jgi:hypothetical protein
MTEKPKPTRTAAKRTPARKSKTQRRTPTYNEISERAYYIHLQAHESDELANWLRAERELMFA